MIFGNLEAGWLSLSHECSLIYWPCHNTHNLLINHRVWKTQTNQCLLTGLLALQHFTAIVLITDDANGIKLYLVCSWSRVLVFGHVCLRSSAPCSLSSQPDIVNGNCKQTNHQNIQCWKGKWWFEEVQADPAVMYPNLWGCVMSWWFSDSLVWRDNSL